MIFTIGHSNKPLGALFETLKAKHIDILVDVRSKPQSRYNPQYNKKSLIASCKNEDVIYAHRPALGGFSKDLPAMRETLSRLANHQDNNENQNIALMCSELNYGDCHRHYWLGNFLHAGLNMEVIHLKTGTDFEKPVNIDMLNKGKLKKDYEVDGWNIFDKSLKYVHYPDGKFAVFNPYSSDNTKGLVEITFDEFKDHKGLEFFE